MMVKILYFYNDNILAKSNGTSLKKHTCDAVKVLEILLNSDKTLLERRLKLLNYDNYDFNRFCFNLKKAMVFHDFGKASDIWQDNILKIVNGDKVYLPPHAIYSGFFLPLDSKNFIPFLVIISHHSLLTNNSFNKSLSLKFVENYLKDLAEINNFSLEKFDSVNDYFNSMRNFIRKSQRLKFRKIYDSNVKINIFFKAIYCLSLIYLTNADALSSEIDSQNKILTEELVLNKFPSISEIIKNSCNFRGNKELTSIQSLVFSIPDSQLEKPLLLEAPCGEGKTLASLLFAEKLFKKNYINKVIFALPTQITSNNMFVEFRDEYNIPKNWIGIYHSEVLNFLKNIDGIDEENYHLEKYQNLIYSKPFNISTVDHLILSLVNGFKHSPKSFGNMLNSLIIIDELHYYDEYTLSLIEVLCEILCILKIPHIIMSATLPSFVKNKFIESKYLSIKSDGLDKNNIEKNPFEFKFHNEKICDDNLSKDFLDLIQENIDKNIGIIVNTVPMSQKVYIALKEIFPKKQIVLYNSRFMKKDRPIKEKILKCFSNWLYDNITEEESIFLRDFNLNPNEKFIFIGTQVAEISLNMSFDIMISELAPLDALIQRGGRLHRKMTFNNSLNCNCSQCEKLPDNHKYYLHVFETGKYCYPYFTKEDAENTFKENIIDNTRNIIKNPLKFTFNNSITMINDVYDGNYREDYSEFIKLKFKKIIREDLIFGEYPTYSEEDGGQQRIETRNIEVNTVSVLPKYFEYNEDYVSANDFVDIIYKNYNFKDKFTQEGLVIIMEHLISVSINFYHMNNPRGIEIGGKYFRVIDLDYTFEKGLFNDDENQF